MPRPRQHRSLVASCGLVLVMAIAPARARDQSKADPPATAPKTAHRQDRISCEFSNGARQRGPADTSAGVEFEAGRVASQETNKKPLEHIPNVGFLLYAGDKGGVSSKVKYVAMIGDNLSLRGVSASQLNNKLDTQSYSIQRLPTTGEFDLWGAFGDYDHYQQVATRFGAHHTHSFQLRPRVEFLIALSS